MPVDAVAWESAPELLALAMTLTGRTDASAELVGLVLAEAARPNADRDPTTARNRLVQRFVGRRPGSPVLGAGPALPGELERVALGLDRLSPLQRAALVLGYRDRVTNAEIAGVLDRPSTTVERSLADAVRTVDATPTEIAAALDALAWQAPAPEAVRPSLHRAQRDRRTRRRRASAVLGVVVAALVLAVVVPTVVIPRLPVHVRQNQEWANTFAVTPPVGWTVSGRYLTPEQDIAVLIRGESDQCGIRTEALDPTQTPAVGRRVSVRGHRAVFAMSTEDADTHELSWTYAPGARASVSCFPTGQPEELMLELARAVRFERVSLRMPFTLADLPAGLEVVYVGRDLEQVSALLTDRGTDNSGLSVQLPADKPAGQPSSVRMGSDRGQLYVEGGSVALCRDVKGQRACVATDDVDGSGAPRRIAALTREVTAAAGRVRFAPDLGDEATWFDGEDALPH